jgi:hypothetical protein
MAERAEISPAAAAARQRRTILLLLLVPLVVISLVASRLFLGSTSHARPSGSLNGAIQAATEYYRVHGANVDALSIDAAISRADNHWARFTASAVTGTAAATWGWEHFTRRGWAVVAEGAGTAGCPGTVAPGSEVPAPVLAGFGVTCPLGS